ncbi:transcription factor GTE9-like isoform X2 [Coffea arabica]|uniref:Transcription factor GTE9-like isoform X2 n=1 Tax=Coffea arabica TaxID=13443 RepID=A0ABM4U415_COFAR|nr:transcription factor GTE10-like [Coffea arabica]
MAPTVPIEYSGQRELNLISTKGGIGKMMGKSRKVSKGFSSGFVPDYRHAVETMAESEGFGSSGRVDTEMTASEDSCAPKRKCVNLNDREGCARFSVPIHVLPLSKMSRSERKDMELRLRNELEQVRILQRRITAMSSFSLNAVVHSPASDIHSCTDGQRRPPVDSFRRPVKEVPTPPGKKKGPPGRNGPRTKGAGAKRSEPAKQTLPSDPSNLMLMKQCEALLNRLMGHEFGWVFNKPVDVVELNIPDYVNVIKHPMDFGTIKAKLLSGQYSDPLGFASDVRLTLTNAMTYNPPGNDVHFMAKALSKFFEMRWKSIEKKIPAAVEEILPPNSGAMIERGTAIAMPPSKKAKSTPVENIKKPENKVKQENIKRVMSDVEKQKLSADLEPLLTDLPDHIVDFLKESSFNASQASEDEIEIDLDALGDDTLFTLRKLLDEYLMDKQKNQGKDPQAVEVHNESGFSNSFLQPQIGDEPADEDIDIGGNDPPSSSFPPLEIEKETIHRNSKCSGSSSSSSDSDSDTGSSSSGESDAAKDLAVLEPSKDNLGHGENLEQKTGDPETAETMSGLARQNPESILDPVESGCHQEAESAPQERQVSPEKQYRAALLRSRFADTIIKAQEKALEKGEKLDPEKLRREREDLERRRKEEKARLQAEAKAAEDARRKAEEEAAAEVRRKRELEREAARQALQQMEKTVDINENSQFMEDLEMFRSAPDEQLVNFIEETSPEHSQTGLGSFKFQGSSNPLEQLGLYMKKDDEEEEETDVHSVPDASDDPEEGEID